jgi:hypothetical protein
MLGVGLAEHSSPLLQNTQFRIVLHKLNNCRNQKEPLQELCQSIRSNFIVKIQEQFSGTPYPFSCIHLELSIRVVWVIHYILQYLGLSGMDPLFLNIHFNIVVSKHLFTYSLGKSSILYYLDSRVISTFI